MEQCKFEWDVNSTNKNIMKKILLLLFVTSFSFSQEFQGKAYYFSKTILNGKLQVEDPGVKEGMDPAMEKAFQEALKKASEKNYLLTFNKSYFKLYLSLLIVILTIILIVDIEHAFRNVIKR